LGSSLYGAGAEYALHSLLVIAARKAPVSVRDLARFQDLPERFLAKVFSRLEKAGLVQGIEGISGGFVLARPPGRVTVREVLEAVVVDVFDAQALRGIVADHRPEIVIHQLTELALTKAVSGIYDVAESDGAVSSEKACRILGWDAGWRAGRRGPGSSGPVDR
jgi:Rrf2 family protein